MNRLNWFNVVLICTCCLILLNCKILKAQTGETKPEELIHPNLYPTSPFNEKIPSNPEIDENSELMVQNLVSVKEENGFIIALKDFAIPIFYADENTPRYNINLTVSWAPAKVINNVPIPDFAEPDPGIDDKHMVIIDLSTGCEYDFWRARKDEDSGEWEAAWVNTLPIDGDGIFPEGLSARGSGFALPAGIIWPDELERGEINHALQLSLADKFVKGGGPVPPATESDGISKEDGAIPEGALIQLDPDLDLDSITLEPYEKIIARALQIYGVYLVDRSTEMEFQAVNPISVEGNPYEGLLPDVKWVDLPNIPVDKFRVLKLPAQIDNDTELVLNECSDFSEFKFDRDDDDGDDEDGDDEDDDDGDDEKSFTFKCRDAFKTGSAGLERLIIHLGTDNSCTLKLTDPSLKSGVEISTNLRSGFNRSINVTPLNSFADSNGEINFSITAVSSGIDWVAWAIPNEKGEFEFSKNAYDTGLAWGMFVEVVQE